MSQTPKLGKGLGRKRDKPDGRDSMLPKAHGQGAQQAAPLLGVGAPLPSSVDVFAGLALPVYDQGTLGSCTANAGVLYRRFLAQRFKGATNGAPTPPDQDLSRLFLYYQERLLDGDPQSDDGATVRDVFKVMASIGVCPEALDPYVTEDFASPGGNDAPNEIAAAGKYKIGAYHRLPDVDTARSVLASGYAVELGFTVYASFENIGGDGVMPMPQPGESVIGGHAVVIRGYDDTREMLFVQNSWGLNWGSGGCFWMPYAFLQNTGLSQFDMWMGHLGTPWKS
ncbi:MAG: C1 family peptidase, partial [Terriglobia bacterium]